MWVIVIIGIFLLFHYLPYQWLFRRNIFTSILIIPAVINWLYFFMNGMAANKTAVRSASTVDHVVTTGVYAKVRHPIYFANIILAWGIFLLFPTLAMLASAAWLTIVLLAWMKLEEKAMIERFGDGYRRYKAETPMFIPKFSRKG